MAILTVGPTSTFLTIADSIAAAGTGDIISLEAGYGNENALVTVDGLSFDGELSSTGVSLQLDFGVGTITLLGSAPINILDNTAGNTIIGNDGDNVFTVIGGADSVSGGLGSDRLVIDYHLTSGAVTATTASIADAGGTGTTTVTGGIEHFTILTGSGADTITTGAGDDIINSGNGAGTIVAGEGANQITGGSGADTITAGNGGNFVDGGGGDDILTTGSGVDIINAGLGNDTVTAGGGADVTTVNGGLDSVDNGTGDDRLTVDYSGMTTNVTGGVSGGSLAGGYDGNVAVAGGGNSVSFYGTENLTVTTGSGNDTISTGDGDDVLDGGSGFDQLNGGGGNDVFIAGAADDTMNGDSGTDSVIFSGARSDYQVFQTGGSTVLIIDMRNGSPDGMDSLQNFESFVFADGTLDAVTVLVGPPATLVTSLAFLVDTGASNSDFITNTAAQDISGVLDANLVSGETVEVSLDNGATWTTATSSVGSDTFVLSGQTLAGSNVLMARVTNIAGDGTAASQAYVLDSSAPGQPAAPTLSAGSDSGTPGDDITSDTTPTVTGTAEAGSTVTLYDTNGTTVLGTGLADGSGNYSITSTSLTAGAHTLTVKATDAAGNVGVASSGLALAIDTSAPGQPAAPTLSAGSDSGTPGDDITSDTTPTVTGTAEAGSNVTLYDTDGTTLLGTSLADGSGNYSITSTILTAGAHTLTVEATDTAGNVGAASSGLTLAIDTSAPGQPAAPTLAAGSDSGTPGDNITSDTTPTVTGTAEVSSTVTLYDTDGTTVLGTGPADGSGNYSITSTILTAGAHTLTVKATDTAGNVGAASSGLALTLDNVNDLPTGSVIVSGIATENQTLTASHTLVDAEGLGTITYQWQRNGVDIDGATTSTYVLGDGDVETAIRVIASYTDGNGTPESVPSVPTGSIGNVNDLPTGSVTISGIATEYQTLTASNTLVDVDGPGDISYQWQRNGVDINGATASTYVLGDADVETMVSVIASYTDGHGTPEAVTSEPVMVPNIIPTLGGDRAIAIAKGGTTKVTTADLTATDSDNTNAQLVYTVTGSVHGTVLVNGIAAASFTQANIAANNVTFRHDGGAVGGSFSVSLTDGRAESQTATVTAATTSNGFTVGPNSNYPSIAAAMLIAGANDIILLEAGYRNETATVTHAGMTVVGGATSTRIMLNLATGIAGLTLTGTASINVSGVSAASIVGNGGNNIITTGAGNDTLSGGAGNDTLNGGNLDDTLIGGIGTDSLRGGTGNDVYVLDRGADAIIDTGGNDTIMSSASRTLAGFSTIENLTLTGDANIHATGNSFDNTVTGNAGNNLIVGGAGDDRLSGGLGEDNLRGGVGDDTYLLEDGRDIIIEGSGVDRILSSISRTLSSYTSVENLKLIGDGTINGTGNDTDNDLYGNNGDNALYGKGGNDYLYGDAGVDRLHGGSGRDRFDFNEVSEIGRGLGSRDIVMDFVSGEDDIDLATIDASIVAGNQAFRFIAAEHSTFSGVTAELIWDIQDNAGTANDRTLLMGDIDGNKVADFHIELTGLQTMLATDLVL